MRQKKGKVTLPPTTGETHPRPKAKNEREEGKISKGEPAGGRQNL